MYKKILLCIIVPIWTFLAILASQFIVYVLINSISKIGTYSLEDEFVGNILTSALEIFFVIVLPSLITKKNLTTRLGLGLADYPTFIDLALAPAGFVIYFILSMFMTSLANLLPFFIIDEKQDVGFETIFEPSEKILAFISLVIVAPICEEVLMRGFTYGHLRELTNDMKITRNSKKKQSKTNLFSIILCSLVTSILFAILHGQWNVGVDVFCLSLVLCGLREVTGTIYAGIFLHILKNLLAFLFTYIFI